MIKILCRYFGFFIVSQKGSHVKLRNIKEEKVKTVIVPTHRELAFGTFRSILEMAGIREDEFRNRL